MRVPTLDEVFEAVGQKLYINVEIKSISPTTDGVEQVVADVIAKFNLQNRVIVSSFNPLTLKRFREILPEVAIGFLYAMDMTVDTQKIMYDLNLPYEAVHPYHSMIDAVYMQSAKSAGYRVNTWTVNDPEQAVKLRDLGVDC
ncbi:MAG: glycerophosphodiester phosphodiesterase [Cyanobacteria bacterium RM1_2_2]|nr:glycerophosphodiester phosphodiesterase [Cyanobacteria bacterium RM1_2_2]